MKKQQYTGTHQTKQCLLGAKGSGAEQRHLASPDRIRAGEGKEGEWEDSHNQA